MAKKLFLVFVCFVVSISTFFYFFYPPFLWSLVIFIPIILLGFYDLIQTKQAILRNFPLLGHFRYLLEEIRPEINQYFKEEPK